MVDLAITVASFLFLCYVGMWIFSGVAWILSLQKLSRLKRNNYVHDVQHDFRYR